MKKNIFKLLVVISIILIIIGFVLLLYDFKKDKKEDNNKIMNPNEFGYLLDDYDMKAFLITRFMAYGEHSNYEISARIFNRTNNVIDQLYLKFILYNNKNIEYIHYVYVENLGVNKYQDIFFQSSQNLEGLKKYKVELTTKEEMLQNGYEFID